MGTGVYVGAGVGVGAGTGLGVAIGTPNICSDGVGTSLGVGMGVDVGAGGAPIPVNTTSLECSDSFPPPFALNAVTVNV